MLKKIFYTILFCLLFSNQALSIVDVRLANYSDTWKDLEIPGSGYTFEVKRTYNSRSLFDGMFGFGWCSDFETKFTIQPDGSIKLKECGDGRTVVFRTSDFTASDTKNAIAKVLSKIKETNRSFNARNLKRLKTAMENDPKIFESYAKRYGVKSQIRANTVYRSVQDRNETLVKTNKFFERTTITGEKQRFNFKGMITHFYDPDGNYLHLKYNKRGRLIKIADNNKRQLNFTHYPNGKIKSISGPGGMNVSYKYKRQNDLVRVKTAWGNSYTYTYDQLHNLTRVTYPDKTFKAIKYDTDKDWVLGFTGRNKCTENFRYQMSPKNPRGHYWVNVVKKCGLRLDSKAKYEFWYKTKNTGGKYLARAKSVINNSSIDIYYSGVFEKPVKTIKNGVTTLVSYYPNGLVKARRVGKKTMRFKYNNKFNKVSELKAGNLRTVFNYGPTGNLINAKSTDGREVKLKYDKRGRVISLIDQAHRAVNITYDNRFGKPKKLSRPGVGDLVVQYRSNGDLRDVNSNQGPVVATQIASTFNGLLEIISPSGINLGI